MVFINEWLPNPVGSDAKGEFIELYNNGSFGVEMHGWTIQTNTKKNIEIPQTYIRPGGYFILRRPAVKFSLKNSGGYLALYNASGKLLDNSSFLGSAQEGKSLSRVNYTLDTSQHFAWSHPTPGGANMVNLNTEIFKAEYPRGVSLNHAALPWQLVCGIGILTSAVVALLVVYCLKSNAKTQEFFFKRNHAPR